MIFVTVGSQKFQFNRLLIAVDQLVESEQIIDDVFAQSGACDYIPRNYKSIAYLDREDFKTLMEQCDLVITHGGTGAIFGALKAGKKVIAVPRLSKYGEHVDDHQKQVIEEFEKGDLISSCEDLRLLGKVIRETRKKVFDMYKSNTHEYLREIDCYIEQL